MSYQRLLRKMIGVTWVTLLLLGCNIPVVTPVSEAPAPIATPVPTVTTPTSGPVVATSIDDIVGTWYGLGSGLLLYHRFNNDGTFRIAYVRGQLEDQPNVTGEFWFEGKQLFMRELEVLNVTKCGSEPVIYEAQLLANGNLELVKVEDECAGRVNATEREHEPVP